MGSIAEVLLKATKQLKDKTLPVSNILNRFIISSEKAAGHNDWMLGAECHCQVEYMPATLTSREVSS